MFYLYSWYPVGFGERLVERHETLKPEIDRNR